MRSVQQLVVQKEILGIRVGYIEVVLNREVTYNTPKNYAEWNKNVNGNVPVSTLKQVISLLRNNRVKEAIESCTD